MKKKIENLSNDLLNKFKNSNKKVYIGISGLNNLILRSSRFLFIKTKKVLENVIIKI
jgi:hypothetical protein